MNIGSFGIIGFVLLCSLVGIQPAAAAREVTIIYSGNMDGELEPCGCSAEGDYGGILRRASMVERLRKERPGLFLLEAGGLLSTNSAHGRLTGEYILKGIATLKYDAIGVQWGDLIYGSSFAQAVGLPWVSSNWRDDSFEHERSVKRGGVELAYFSWLDPQSSPEREMLGQHETVYADSGRLAAALKKANSKGALTVLATTLSLPDAQAQLPLAEVDILIIAAKYEVFGEPQKVGRTLVLQPGSRGMRLARVDLTLDRKGGIATWKHAVIQLPNTVPDADWLSAWYEEYNNRIKEEYQRTVERRKAEESGETPYAGDEACQSCHADAYAVWEKSRHAHAFDALEKVKKSYDPDCIQCHTVGFNKPGGFIDAEASYHLRNVQCESCHGAARAHVEAQGAKPVANAGWEAPQMCAQCHTQPHSPGFRFGAYWPKIAH